jgi:DNA-binding MarR family transcriptional regulator
LRQLIEELQLSKQAVGQLVDVLVTRGYVKREVDSEDRRRLTVGLTERGRAACSSYWSTLDEKRWGRVRNNVGKIANI